MTVRPPTPESNIPMIRCFFTSPHPFEFWQASPSKLTTDFSTVKCSCCKIPFGGRTPKDSTNCCKRYLCSQHLKLYSGPMHLMAVYGYRNNPYPKTFEFHLAKMCQKALQIYAQLCQTGYRPAESLSGLSAGSRNECGKGC